MRRLNVLTQTSKIVNQLSLIFFDPSHYFPLGSWQNSVVTGDLFFHHAEFLIHRFEVKSEKAWSIEQVLEVDQSDFPYPFVDGGHERSDGPVGEIEDLGRSWCYIRVTATLVLVVVGSCVIQGAQPRTGWGVICRRCPAICSFR